MTKNLDYSHSVSVRKPVEALLQALCIQHDIYPIPLVQWSVRMKKTLGRAYPQQRMIRLSTWLDFSQAMNTLRHELAHIAIGYSTGDLPHGDNWRRWAVRLGAEPRASSLFPPTYSGRGGTGNVYWGLKCLGCGSRFLRARVKPGLYHRTCGPSDGRLERMIHGIPAAVIAWIGDE
jgi:predicted SprT family Zn-dependent metalloprotease